MGSGNFGVCTVRCSVNGVRPLKKHRAQFCVPSLTVATRIVASFDV